MEKNGEVRECHYHVRRQLKRDYYYYRKLIPCQIHVRGEKEKWDRLTLTLFSLLNS
ncbi:uncharacterized protein G2W53_028149 [Senna tora]|uniref:Uncharacterized protein n=1 Tax=Senna tora TaxID=362788 RepID=A0A834T244_9FABA|nr:uncharacterized protein G2W53_028149 [Senna tora]